MKNHLLTIVFTTLLSFVLTFTSFGQAFEKTKELLRMTNIPNSPEAQAFSQYGNIDVGLYTGTPNIQVPLYVHKGRELDLPISLTYDASGIKVEQESTNVGLGWNLNVGGRISRLANGFPDDYIVSEEPYQTFWNNEVQGGILQYIDNHLSFPSKDDAITYLSFLKKLNDNEYDALPDYYSFNALGNNDMLVIDVTDRIPKALNNPRIKVEINKTFSTTYNPGSITKWTVTMGDGTKYIFDEREVTDTQHYNDVSVAALNGMHQTYNSSWLLTDIYSPTGKDHYEFTYQELSNTPILLSTQKAFITSVVNYTQNPDPNAFGGTQYVSPTTTIGLNDAIVKMQQQALVQIKHNDKIIIDINLKSRYDLNISSAIDNIEILNNGNLHKAYKFNHDYFKTSSGIDPVSTSTLYSQLRLKLDGIDIKDSNNNIVSNYAFDYIDPTQLPKTNSYAQDYYGYFNGKSNSVLYPKTIHENVIDGADRSVSFFYAKRGILNKITYPTRGYSIFDYEANKSSYVTPNEEAENTFFQSKANLTLQGGELCNDFYNCPDSECVDTCIPAYMELGAQGPPEVSHQVFYIEEAGEYLYSSSLFLNNDGIAGLIPGQKAIFFKRSDITIVKPNPPSAKTLDEIYDFSTGAGDVFAISNNDLMYYNNSSNDYDIFEQPIILQSGYYQITLVNPQEGSTSSFRLGRYETNTTNTGGEAVQIEKAGLRIKTIQDYSQDGQLALKKEYSYSDGTVISQPFYEYLVTDYTVEDFWGQDGQLAPMLYRNSYASGTERPHIGYNLVTEAVVDFYNSQNKISTYNDFYTTNWGSYFSGVYTYYNNGKETAKNYGVTYKLGKAQQISSEGNMTSGDINTSNKGIKYINSYTYEDKQYYQNRGVYTRVVENRNHLYSVPQPNGTGDWFIDFIPPELIPSLDGSVLIDDILAGSNNVSSGGVILLDNGEVGEGVSPTIYYTSPDECLTEGIPSELCSIALGRLNLQIASAYGKAGYLKESTNYELQGDFSDISNNSIKQTTTNSYYDSDPLSDLDFLLKNQITTINDGKVTSQDYFYPDNFPNEYTGLRSNHMINIPVETKSYKGESDDLTLISTQKTEYIGTYPSKIQTSKGEQNLEDRLIFERYVDGNLVQVKQADGTHISYIWGYANRYVIAKIENVTYTEIENLNAFGSGFTITDKLTTTQENALRGMSNVLVTTYEYSPMVGVTSITDPNGQRVTYHYDDFNRLEYVKDKNGDILSQNQYNYKN